MAFECVCHVSGLDVFGRTRTHIATQTLIIHALDDPFMTPEVLPQADELSSDITLELSSSGGHVGFISGKLPGKPLYWLEQRIPDYLQKIFATLH